DPFRIAVRPDGKSAYATDRAGVVDQFDIDQSSGQLSPKTPASVAAPGKAWGIGDIGVSPYGSGVYVTNDVDDTVAQYDVDPSTGRLTPKTPSTVATGSVPYHLVVGPRPRVPTSKKQCKHGGWHNFPRFKNQGQCLASVGNGK